MTRWEQIIASMNVVPSVQKKPKELVPEKMCTSCKVIKKRAEFYHRSDHSPNALMSRCKECVISGRKQRREAERAKYRIGDNSFDQVATFQFPD